MGWERGRYYTRSRKVNGRIVREYVGSGEAGKLAAQIDAIRRADREMERDLRRMEKAELAVLDAPLKELNDLANLLARSALVAAGYRQHNRGEWRKRRGKRNRAEPERPEGNTPVAGAGVEGG